MGKAIKGLAKIDVRDEVDLCVKGLRSKDRLEIAASAQQLERGVADVLGTALVPFANLLGGDLAACVKRHGKDVPDAVWDAAAGVALAVGSVAAKPLCEPLLELLLHSEAARTPAALGAAQTFVATALKYLPVSLRNGIDSICVKYLYDALVFEGVALDVDMVAAYLDVLCASVTAPAAFGFNPLTSHAMAALRHAVAAPKLGPHLRTTARCVLNALDAQAHCPSAPVAVPTLEEVYTYVKQLEGVSANELAFFDGPAEGLSNAADAQIGDVSGLMAPPPPPAAAAVAAALVSPPPALSEQAAPTPVVAPPAVAPAPATPAPSDFDRASQLSDDGLLTPCSLATPVPAEGFALPTFMDPTAAAARKRSRSPDAPPADDPPAKKPTLLAPPSMSFGSDAAVPSAQTLPDSVPSTEPENAGDGDDYDDNSDDESLEVPDVDLGGL